VSDFFVSCSGGDTTLPSALSLGRDFPEDRFLAQVEEFSAICSVLVCSQLTIRYRLQRIPHPEESAFSARWIAPSLEFVSHCDFSRTPNFPNEGAIASRLCRKLPYATLWVICG
jgi:hypothetical protein